MKRIQILAILAAVITVIAAYFYLNQLEKAKEIPTSIVITANVDIKAKTQVTQEMVIEKEIPTIALTPNAITSYDQVVGKIVNNTIFAGEQIVSTEIAELGLAAGELSYVVEPDKRAITIPVNPVTGVALMIEPGNKIDIMGTYENGEVKPVLENILVLAVGKRMTPGTSASPESSYETVTLSLSPTEVDKMLTAQTKAGFTLALRSSVEKQG